MSKKKALSGWLGPNGDFTPVFWGEHETVSEELCYTLGLEEFLLSEKELRKRGWLLISCSMIAGKSPVINIGLEPNTHFTDSQKNFLRPYFEDKENYEFFNYLYDVWEEENKA